MASPPGSRTYGMLSVFCQAEAECKVLFRVPRDEFRPVPDVDSCVVRLEPLPTGSAGIEDAETFSAIVRGAFEHRRKTCYNSLRLSFEKGACSELLRPGADIDAVLAAALEDAGIDGSLRPEQFGVQDYVALANHFARLK